LFINVQIRSSKFLIFFSLCRSSIT